MNNIPHISAVVDFERIMAGPQEMMQIKLDCGHQDEIASCSIRRPPTVWRCTQCEGEGK